MSPIKLHVYDFDGTLFRSPEKPVWWKGGWWGNLDSLSPPCVPERPSSDWWNGTVVAAAKQSLSNPDARTILLTGRIQKFSLRLKDLLRQAGLHFDEIYLSPGGKTEAFKMKVIAEILKKEPSIRGVSIWEDRGTHLRMFADWIESNGRACIPHLVTVSAHELDCGPPVEESASRLASAIVVAARYKSKTTDDEGNVHYEYSERQVSNRHSEKAKRVEKLRKEISDLRAKVRKDLSSEDASEALPALAAALIDETCERVGNEESAEEGHYGVTGWRKKHLSFSNGEAIFKYVGKSGVKHEKKVSAAPVVKLLKELAKGKGAEDCLLSRDGFTVKPNHVNDYLGEFDVTAKDIRGFRANQEMCKALKARRKKGPELPRPRKERDKILKKEFADALEEVADIVGHEKATLRSDYLVPGLEDAYMKDGTVVSTFKEASRYATKTDSEKENEAVESMVKPEPKKKPPRDDLRERRLRPEDDDLSAEDDDLSLNFKKVASRVAMAVRLAERFLSAKKEREDDDAFLEQIEGKTFTNPETKQKVKFESLPASEQKKIRSQLQKDREKKDREESERDRSEPGKENPERVKAELLEEAKYLGEAPAFDEDTSDFVESTLDRIMDTIPLKDSKEFVAGLTSARKKGIDALSRGESSIEGKPPSEKQVKKHLDRVKELSDAIRLVEADDEDPESKKSLESLTKKRDSALKDLKEDFAKFYAHKSTVNAVRNPLTLLGDTSSPISQEGALERASKSVSRFRNLSSEERGDALKEHSKVREETESEIKDLEKKLSEGSANDPERKANSEKLESLKNRLGYLDADRKALEFSALVEGDEVKDSSIPPGTRTLVKALKESGVDVSDMLDAGFGVSGAKPDARTVSKLVSQLRPEQMEKALEAVDPSGKLKDAWRKVNDADSADEYRWPMSKIVKKKERRDVENAHAVFVEMLTDIAVGDASVDQLSPVSAPPSEKKKKGPKKSPESGISGPDEGFSMTEDFYESKVMETMPKLDIPKTASYPVRTTWPVFLDG